MLASGQINNSTSLHVIPLHCYSDASVVSFVTVSPLEATARKYGWSDFTTAIRSLRLNPNAYFAYAFFAHSTMKFARALFRCSVTLLFERVICFTDRSQPSLEIAVRKYERLDLVVIIRSSHSTL